MYNYSACLHVYCHQFNWTLLYFSIINSLKLFNIFYYCNLFSKTNKKYIDLNIQHYTAKYIAFKCQLNIYLHKINCICLKYLLKFNQYPLNTHTHIMFSKNRQISHLFPVYCSKSWQQMDQTRLLCSRKRNLYQYSKKEVITLRFISCTNAEFSSLI